MRYVGEFALFLFAQDEQMKVSSEWAKRENLGNIAKYDDFSRSSSDSMLRLKGNSLAEISDSVLQKVTRNFVHNCRLHCVNKPKRFFSFLPLKLGQLVSLKDYEFFRDLQDSEAYMSGIRVIFSNLKRVVDRNYFW